MQAVVLAGGLGTRLGDLTRDVPKSLLPVGGPPLLEWLVRNLERFGFDEILLLAGYRSALVEAFASDSRFLSRVTTVVESEPLGTGGALLNARSHLDDVFLLLNGDTLFDFNYLDLFLRLPSEAAIVVALREVKDARRYGAVRMHEGLVESFTEKGPGGPNLVNGGVYAVRRSMVDSIAGKRSLEVDVLPSLPHGQVAGSVYAGFFIDIGIPSDLHRAQTEVPRHFRRPAAFLDRDGTLNEDSGYTHRPADFHWLPQSVETVKLLNDLGYLVVVVTNQAGVARGLFKEDDVNALHRWMNSDLMRHGAHIDAFYFCPHHPTEGEAPYVGKCDCRKPAPGLIARAMSDWSIDVGRSFGVGDKESDRMAYEAAGIKPTFRSVSELYNALRVQSVEGPDRPNG
jgi:D,D-heptose 1,7-bisphosphate phosphatase